LFNRWTTVNSPWHPDAPKGGGPPKNCPVCNNGIASPEHTRSTCAHVAMQSCYRSRHDAFVRALHHAFRRGDFGHAYLRIDAGKETPARRARYTLPPALLALVDNELRRRAQLDGTGRHFIPDICMMPGISSEADISPGGAYSILFGEVACSSDTFESAVEKLRRYSPLVSELGKHGLAPDLHTFIFGNLIPLTPSEGLPGVDEFGVTRRSDLTHLLRQLYRIGLTHLRELSSTYRRLEQASDPLPRILRRPFTRRGGALG